MKKTLLTLGILSSTIAYAQYEQRVGINTETPKTTLEVAGDPTNTKHFDGIIAPRITGDQLKAKTYGTDQTGALVYVSAATTTPEGQTINVKSAGYYYFDGKVWQTTKPLTYTAGRGISISDNNEISRTGFEEVTENGKTGWRLIGKNANNYGDIGTEALDASYSSSASSTRGATGNYSVALGYNATASGEKSFAGLNGTASGKETIAMGRNATATEEWSIALGYVDVTGANSAAIGNWAKSNVASNRSFAVGSGNELTSTGNFNFAYGYNNKIPESGSIFTIGASNNVISAASYAIGRDNTITSNGYYNHIFGFESKITTGSSSFAIGQKNTINESSSYAFGSTNTISGYGSVVVGYNSQAQGNNTFAWGSGVIATPTTPIAIGRGSNQLTISDTGNVAIGLGANAATEKLEVNGNAKIKGSIKLEQQTTLPEKCTNGEIIFSNNMFYGCINNSWKSFTLID